MRLSTATIPGSDSLFDSLDSIAAAGFTGIELNESDLIRFDGAPEEVSRRAASLGLTVETFQYLHDFDDLSVSGRNKVFQRLERQLDLLQTIGAKTLLVAVSAHAKHTGRGPALIDDLAELTTRVNSRNARAALIALPWTRPIQTETQALALVEAIDHRALGLALNSCDCLSGGVPPSRLRSIPGARLFHVQLSDGPMGGGGVAQPNRRFGVLPGHGDLPLVNFVRILARLGYTGPWSLAYASHRLSDHQNTLTADGFRALVALLDEAARVEPALSTPMPDLPARVYPTGFEFIEFAVDEESHSMLTEILRTLCFRKERQHVSKSVQLWRQGAINVVVNSETKGFAAESFARNGPSVCDMALRVRDANQAVMRAKQLGTREFFQPVAAGESEIPAIRGVGGSVVHFIDEKSDLHRLWDIEFDAVPKTQAVPPAGLRRIDHVAQTMLYQEMQSWLTYYTTTFEMDKTSIVDVDDPCGVVFSQAIASPEGEVRLNLNGVEEYDTFAGTFLVEQFDAGVQHIAFMSDDIFETSAHLKRSGMVRLKIPDDYYVELKDRWQLNTELVEQLRANHILYDRDGDGEYFQIYSVPFFQGFFFEVVERRGGYQGYGARNAPIRLAAQLRNMQDSRV